MKIKRIHNWRLNVNEARRIQDSLHSKVRLEWEGGEIKTIAGADVSYKKEDQILLAGVVVMSFPEMEIIEASCAFEEARLPYIPGFLSFREGPAILNCFERLKTRVDLGLFDGQGIAHSRGLGLASHMGLFLGIPTVGCAKSRLVGTYSMPGEKRGQYSYIMYKGSRVGVVLRTRTNVRPLFVSPGHSIDLKMSKEFVLRTLSGYRSPEPLRLAHILANRLKRQWP